MRAEIRISDRSQITISEDDRRACAAAWRAVAAGIIGADPVLARFEAAWIEAVLHGDDLRKLEASLAVELSRVDWSWPWFQEWLLRFRSAADWPRMWREIGAILADDQIGDAAKVAAIEPEAAKLISCTAMRIFYRDRHPPSERILRPGWSWRIAVIDDSGGKAEQRVADLYRSAIQSGDLSHLPPFFPGDRTTLQLLSPRQKERWGL